MLKLKVPEMSCGHCVSTIEKAVKSVDPTARVMVDMKSSAVSVETKADDKTISAAITSAGYENEKLPA